MVVCPGGFGVVTITKSITIDCMYIPGSVLSGATNGIIVNATNAGANDPLRTVRIRGITINGAGNGTRVGIRGISILSALIVHIDDVVIDNFTQQGIADVRTGGGKLFIGNTISRNNAGAGIGIAATGGTLNATIDNSRFEGNGIGIAVGPGNNVMVKRSVMSSNGSNGIQADGGQITLDGAAINGNATGILANAAATVRLTDCDIMFNTLTAINGATTSFGFNRIAANAAVGTAPTAAGGPTNALGTQ